MKNKTLMVLMSLIVALNTGCASYFVRDAWVDAQQKKAVRVEANGQQVMVGLDIGAISYLSDNWPMALSAAVVDAGVLYGGYVLVDKLVINNSDTRSTSATSGRDSNIISIDGNNNNVRLSGDATTTTTP